MISQDYIKRMMQQLFDALNNLKTKVEKESFEDVNKEVKSMYLTYLKQDFSYFYNSNCEQIINNFKKEASNTLFIKVEMLSELLYQDSILEKDEAIKKSLSLKVLFLLGFLDKESKVYSQARILRIEKIRDQYI